MREVNDSHILLKEDHFNICVRANMGAFVLAARGFTDSKETRKEIIQESLRNVWKRLSKLTDEEFFDVNLTAYISKAIYHQGLKYRKSLTSTQLVENIEDYLEYSYEDNGIHQYRQTLANYLQKEETTNYFIEKAEWVKATIGEKKFEILMMWGVDELSYEDIARITGKTVPSIRNIIFNARKKLTNNEV